VTEWLARQGAGCLHLVSRTGMVTPALTEVLQPGSAAYTSLVTISSADTSAGEDLAGLLAAAGRQGRPVSAVLHAGGVLADATLANQGLAGELGRCCRRRCCCCVPPVLCVARFGVQRSDLESNPPAQASAASAPPRSPPCGAC
jgi:hypothetical protein